MDDYIRRKGYRQPSDEDLFSDIFDDFEGIEPVEIGKEAPEVEEVEEAEPSSAIIEQFKFEDVETDEEDEFTFGTIRERAYSQKEIDFEENEGVEFKEGTDNLYETATKYEELNNELAKDGIRRRYIMSDTDASPLAHVYEDGIGKYFYKINARVRPSDMTDVIDHIDSPYELSEKGRNYGAVLLLAKAFPWVTMDIDSESAADSFLERALITEKDDLENEDVFSVEQVGEIKDILLNR